MSFTLRLLCHLILSPAHHRHSCQRHSALPPSLPPSHSDAHSLHANTQSQGPERCGATRSSCYCRTEIISGVSTSCVFTFFFYLLAKMNQTGSITLSVWAVLNHLNNKVMIFIYLFIFLCVMDFSIQNALNVPSLHGVGGLKEHLKANYVTTPCETLFQFKGSSRCSFFSLFLEDAPLRSFVASHIPKFFVCPKRKKEREKMATLRGVDRHCRGPGLQISWRKGKTSGDATRKCSKG